MQFLCDTNILVHLAKPDDIHHQVAIDATAKLHEMGHQPVIIPQCCYEFYVVATRTSKENGLGMSPTDAYQAIKKFTSLFRLQRDERSIFDEWIQLVKQHAVRGKTAHDARIAAAMIRHGITQLLSFNPGDFKRYTQIQTLTPPEVLAS